MNGTNRFPEESFVHEQKSSGPLRKGSFSKIAELVKKKPWSKKMKLIKTITITKRGNIALETVCHSVYEYNTRT